MAKNILNLVVLSSLIVSFNAHAMKNNDDDYFDDHKFSIYRQNQKKDIEYPTPQLQATNRYEGKIFLDDGDRVKVVSAPAHKSFFQTIKSYWNSK